MNFKEFLIQENKLRLAIDHLKDSDMPKGKIAHSRRVMRTVHGSGAGRDAAMAAAFHDYLERGGSIELAKSKFRLSPKITNVISHLSELDNIEQDSDTNNGPLAHIISILTNNNIPIEERQIVATIKIADRLDNLLKRGRKPSKNYIYKSQELLNYLFNFYYHNFGKDKTIKHLHLQYQGLNSNFSMKRQFEIPKWKQWKMQRELPNIADVG